MRTSQLGDRVRVHYVQQFQDGAVRSSRTVGAPLEVTVGTEHRLVPGLGLGLLGLTEGQVVTIDVPADRAYGLPTADRIKRVTRARFAAEDVVPGTRARMRLTRGRARTVRVMEVHGDVIVVDLNHPRCGQSVRVEIELMEIIDAGARVEPRGS